MNGSLAPPPGVSPMNFSPVPTNLPAAAEAEVKKLFDSERMCSMYLSHRSPEFIFVLDGANKLAREVMSIPDNYEVLFMHGGGHGQFAATPLNLCSSKEDKATYIVNGTWSQRAAVKHPSMPLPLLYLARTTMEPSLVTLVSTTLIWIPSIFTYVLMRL